MKDILVINPTEKLGKFSDLWSPKIITELNDVYVKLAKFKGEYIWHKHDNEDELFFVMSGHLKIELREKILVLKAGELVVIPKGVEHRPVADEEVFVMLIESKNTISTGGAQDTGDKKATQGEWI